MSLEKELGGLFLQALSSFAGGWLTISTNAPGETAIDVGRGRFADIASFELFERPSPQADYLFSVTLDGRKTEFVCEVKNYLSPGRVTEIKTRLQQSALERSLTTKAIAPELMVLAGYMTQATREVLRAQHISYFDSSGSLYLQGRNFVVQASGRDFPPEFKRQGGGTLRMDSPKVSRVVRALLTGYSGGVRELAAGIKVDPSYVSRILSSLAEIGYVRKQRGKSLMDINFALDREARGELLDAWTSSPRPFWRKKELYRLPQPTPDDVERQIIQLCKEAGENHALTLWSAANKYSKTTTVAITALYCETPSSLQLDRLSARAVGESENLWLLTPRDQGVFQFKKEVAGFVTVHPSQIHYDLLHAPYRGESAAAMFRSEYLGY